jgi:phage shock protein C
LEEFDMKKMFRSRDDRVLAGVCGGIGELYSIDPKLIRLIFVFIGLATGIIPILITYVVAWIVLPEKDIS